MLMIVLSLLGIIGAISWILQNDPDEIHQITAVITGGIAIIWIFIVSSLTIKIIGLFFVLVGCKQLYSFTK